MPARQHMSLLLLLMVIWSAGRCLGSSEIPATSPVKKIWQKAEEPVGPGRWQAQWIWCKGETKGINLFWLARKTFTLKRKPRSARLYITADSRYKLYVNGTFVNRGPARCIPERQSFDILDVSPLLQPGKNVLAILVYHYGVPTSRYNLGRPGLLVQLEIQENGRRLIVKSDDSWRGKKGEAWVSGTPRIHTWGRGLGLGEGFTEILDFRKYDPGGQTLAFDDSNWERAHVIPWPHDWPLNNPPPMPRAVMRPWVSLAPRDLPYLRETRLRAAKVVQEREVVEYQKLLGLNFDVALQLAEDVIVPLKYCRIEGVSAYEQGKGPLVVTNAPLDDAVVERHGIRSAYVVLDLGDARNGHARLEISGERGTIVDIAYAPFLVGGRVVPTFMNMRNADRIILSGGRDVWEAQEWRNFRYLALTIRNTSRPVKIDYAGMTAIGYPFPGGGSLEVEGDPELNQLWRAAAKTVRTVTTDGYMDNYREQFQYAGTSYYAARANDAAFGDTFLQKRYLRQLPLSLMVDRVMLPAYPGNNEQGRRVILEYNLLWIMGLRDYLVRSADRRTVAELLPTLRVILGRFREMENSHGLLEAPPYAYWIDWANIDRRGVSFVLNAFYLLALRDAATVARSLDEKPRPYPPPDAWFLDAAPVTRSLDEKSWAAALTEKAGNVRERLRQQFWDPKRGLFGDAEVNGELTGRFSEHANSLALVAGIATKAQAASIAGELIADGSDDVVKVSPLFMYFVTEGLFRAGHGKEALDILKRRFRHVLAAGYGTLWEGWSLTANKASGRWRPSSRTLAQAEASFPAYTLSRWLLGLDPVEAGKKELRIRYTECGLRSVRGTIPTPNGLVSIAWLNRRNTHTLEITLPREVSAQVDLSAFEAPSAEVLLDGKVLGTFATEQRVKVPPGNHRLVVRSPDQPGGSPYESAILQAK